MSKLLSSLVLAAVLAAPVSVSAASGLHWNLAKPVFATCADGSILDTSGTVRGGLLSIYEWVRRSKCELGK